MEVEPNTYIVNVVPSSKENSLVEYQKNDINIL